MNPKDLITLSDPSGLISEILSSLHKDGPIDQTLLERLAYLKYFHPASIAPFEPRLMYLLGLFYKTTEPKDLLSLAYGIFQNTINEAHGTDLTPVQSSIHNSITQNHIFTFSAPTSTGKSYIIRNLILRKANDIVIVLPSRALIAEYLIAVRKILKDHKDVLVLQFIDDINKTKTNRRVFIITPERGGDLFRYREQFNVSVFIFDEAQIADEGLRGLTFDSFVRRSESLFPSAKKVFVHPFVENPEAQLSKHHFTSNTSSYAFKQNAVGKLFVEYNNRSRKFMLFSPHIAEGHLKKNKAELDYDLPESILSSGGSILIYVSKSFIYHKDYFKEFNKYIQLCSPITNPAALEIIDRIAHLIGATGTNSDLVNLLRHGIVIHHGSIPLSVRYLLEDFANRHFSRICFATSTLAHGVNIPFDLVWIDNLRFYGTDENRTIGLKNLIGRAGRTSSSEKNKFDFGYVVTTNSKAFIERYSGKATLSPDSILEDAELSEDEDVSEFIESVKDSEINDIYSLPQKKVDRLSSEQLKEIIEELLNIIFVDERLITGDEYQSLDTELRNIVKNIFHQIYELSLNRELGPGEKSVLSTAISILLWQIQGKSFRTLIGLRNTNLTKRTERRAIRRRFLRGEINRQERDRLIGNVEIGYSQVPSQLPNKGLQRVNQFRGMKYRDFNYDLLVYDTYDYVDKVISFSLSDIFVTAFDQHYLVTQDRRSNDFVNFIRFGTTDEKAILLLRYGFTPDNIEDLIPHISEINEDGIVFHDTINEIDDEYDSYLVEHYR